jgi:hydrogenase expression/formation protein HypC
LSGECRSCLAIPGKIVGYAPEDQNSAIVEALGMRRKIDVALIQDCHLAPGDWVLIHVGFAMSKITEQDALDRLRTMELLEEKDTAAREFCGYAQPDAETAPVSLDRRLQP